MPCSEALPRQEVNTVPDTRIVTSPRKTTASVVSYERSGTMKRGGLIAVVVGELFGSLAGLGFLIANSAQKFDTAMLLAGVFTLAGIAMILVETLKWIEHRMAPWREATE